MQYLKSSIYDARIWEGDSHYYQYQVDYVMLAAADIPTKVIENYFEQKFANDLNSDMVVKIQQVGGFRYVAHHMVNDLKRLVAKGAISIIKGY